MQKKVSHWLLVLIGLALAMLSCRKENLNNNLSKVTSISVEAKNVIMPSFIIDKSGNYLIVCIRDLDYSKGIIKKINLNTLEVESEISLNHIVPVGLNNITLTDNNEIVTNLFRFENPAQCYYKFDLGLNVIKIDTLATQGGNYGRRRMVKSGPNRIVAVETNVDANQKWFLKYMTLDDNLNILSQVIDSSSAFGDFLIPEQFIKTQDGGSLYVGDYEVAPYYNDEVFLEKRDANFNLQWRKRYTTSTSNSATCVKETNGKFYVWAHGTDNNFSPIAYMLVYDQQGNLLQNTVMKNEATVSADAENMVVTDNNDFLILGTTSLNSVPGNNKGILFHADASLGNVTNKTFGGEGNVFVSAILKRESNKYLVMYLERSFAPDGAQPRLVFRYVDSKGNFIE